MLGFYGRLSSNTQQFPGLAKALDPKIFIPRQAFYLIFIVALSVFVSRLYLWWPLRWKGTVIEVLSAQSYALSVVIIVTAVQTALAPCYMDWPSVKYRDYAKHFYRGLNPFVSARLFLLWSLEPLGLHGTSETPILRGRPRCWFSNGWLCGYPWRPDWNSVHSLGRREKSSWRSLLLGFYMLPLHRLFVICLAVTSLGTKSC
jgi:hypothetical protein